MWRDAVRHEVRTRAVVVGTIDSLHVYVCRLVEMLLVHAKDTARVLAVSNRLRVMGLVVLST